MTNALGSGQIRAHVLGIGVDPLTLATDLLTVVVFDAALFDELFGSLVDTNAEGSIIGVRPDGSADGLPFTTEQLRSIAQQPMQPAGAAALSLARRSERRLIS